MDRRVEVTSADGCAVRIRVPARHQSKEANVAKQNTKQAGGREVVRMALRPPASA